MCDSKILEFFKSYHKLKTRLAELESGCEISLSGISYENDVVKTSFIADPTFRETARRMAYSEKMADLSAKMRLIENCIFGASLKAPVRCRKKIRKALWLNLVDGKSSETIAVDGVLVHKNTLLKYRSFAAQYAFEEINETSAEACIEEKTELEEEFEDDVSDPVPIKTENEVKPMPKAEFDYYYEGQSIDKTRFYQLPAILLEYDLFSDLSLNAKLLYVILQDLSKQSVYNKNFIDEKGRAFVILTRKDKVDENGNVVKLSVVSRIRKSFGFSDRSVANYVKELCDFGLIAKERTGGWNNQQRIYVKDYLSQVRKEECEKDNNASERANIEEKSSAIPEKECEINNEEKNENNLQSDEAVIKSAENVGISDNAKSATSIMQNLQYRYGKICNINNNNKSNKTKSNNNHHHQKINNINNKLRDDRKNKKDDDDDDKSSGKNHSQNQDRQKPRDLVSEIPQKQNLYAEEYFRSSPGKRKAISHFLRESGFHVSKSVVLMACQQCLDFGGKQFANAVDVAVKYGVTTLAYTAAILKKNREEAEKKEKSAEIKESRISALRQAEDRENERIEKEFEERYKEQISEVQEKRHVPFEKAKDIVRRRVNEETMERIRNGTLFRKV